jgi:hypothetical protein
LEKNVKTLQVKDMKLPVSGSTLGSGFPTDPGAERAALSRLRVAANLSGGTAVREIRTGIQSEFDGWWFGLRLWRWGTRVADAVLSIRGTGGGVASAIEQFMRQSDIDVARFAIVRSQMEPADITREAHSRRGVWYFLGRQEQRDLLTIGSEINSFVAGLGRGLRRNIRRTARVVAELGIRYSFHERSGPLEVGEEVAGLAARNRPVAIPLEGLDVFEGMLSHRPTSFESRLDAEDGSLISLCRGFIQGRTAYLVYQMNDPARSKISLGLFHNFKLIEELMALGATELIFVMGAHQLKSACRISSKDELITIRPTVRGLAIALTLAVALRGTRFGDGVREVLKSIARYWFGLPKAAYDRRVNLLTPPGKNWAPAIAALLGVGVSIGAVSAGVMMRQGLGSLSYIMAYPAFMVATYFAGAWTGLLTIALGGLGILYYVIPPYNSFALERASDIWATAIYMVSALGLWRWWARRTKPLQAV